MKKTNMPIALSIVEGYCSIDLQGRALQVRDGRDPYGSIGESGVSDPNCSAG